MYISSNGLFPQAAYLLYLIFATRKQINGSVKSFISWKDFVFFFLPVLRDYKGHWSLIISIRKCKMKMIRPIEKEGRALLTTLIARTQAAPFIELQVRLGVAMTWSDLIGRLVVDCSVENRHV